MKKKIHLVAGARPNFMKIAPLYHELTKLDWAEPLIVHTEQHYDEKMSKFIFDDLMLPKPHYLLGVGSGSHGEQTAKVMTAYEKLCMEERPDMTVVVGDVNSTVAAALVAVKLWIPTGHLEAGLRSRDRRMPEEINRLATDAICDVLWTPSQDADANLLAEGVPDSRIDFVGNIMIDSFEMLRDRIQADKTAESYKLPLGEYAVLTLHRPSNVDHEPQLRRIVETLTAVAARVPLMYPVHPRTKKQLQSFGLWDSFSSAPGVTVTDPLPYVQFMNVLLNSRLTITDSGGIQEEATHLGIPCLTMRENTERPITVTHGTNRLTSVGSLISDLQVTLESGAAAREPIDRWDGKTASRVAESIKQRLA